MIEEGKMDIDLIWEMETKEEEFRKTKRYELCLGLLNFINNFNDKGKIFRRGYKIKFPWTIIHDTIFYMSDEQIEKNSNIIMNNEIEKINVSFDKVAHWDLIEYVIIKKVGAR